MKLDDDIHNYYEHLILERIEELGATANCAVSKLNSGLYVGRKLSKYELETFFKRWDLH
jgi:hypothetical protein